MDSARSAELVSMALAGDPSAWRELFERYRVPLEWVARRHRLSRHDVDDVVQNTWMCCVEHLDAVRDPACLLGWLLTTCRRESLRRVRELQRCIPQDAMDVLSNIAAVREPDGDPFDQVARQDDAAQLYEALDELPERQRLVLVGLLQHGDDGYLTASERMGIPIGSIGPTRRRALARLRTDQRLLSHG